MIRSVVTFVTAFIMHVHSARTTTYQSFDQLTRNSGENAAHRTKSSGVDKEKKYRTSLQQSLSSQSLGSQSFSNASVQPTSRKHTHPSVSADRKSLGTLGSKRETYGSIGATSRSLETASTRNTISSLAVRVPPTNQQTVIVQAGGGGGVSKLLNSEAAKAAGAAFGTATAAIVAKGIESRFSKQHEPPSHPAPYPPAGYAPCGGYCR